MITAHRIVYLWRLKKRDQAIGSLSDTSLIETSLQMRKDLARRTTRRRMNDQSMDRYKVGDGMDDLSALGATRRPARAVVTLEKEVDVASELHSDPSKPCDIEPLLP